MQKVGRSHLEKTFGPGISFMPPVTSRFPDKKARLILPRRFANSAVLIEEISDTELRVRKAVIVPEDEMHFTEEIRPPLADHDRDFVLALLANPPAANANQKKALKKYRRRHA
jgi:hypothetical protein